MNFGQALEALKEGKKVYRAHWGGYWFLREGIETFEEMDKATGLCRVVHFNPMIVAYLKGDGGYVPATAYQEDLLAEDWDVISNG